MSIVPRIVGGIGDALLMLDGALAIGEVVVHSHCKLLPSFLAEAGVRVNDFVYYMDPQSIPRYDGPSLEHMTWPRWSLPAHIDPTWAREQHGLTRQTVAVQPFGSPFSTTAHAQRGHPTKTIPQAPLNHLVRRLNEKYDVLIICSQSEADALTIKPPHVILDGSLWQNLAAIWDCAAFIGVDSCGKTMAAIHRIPTYLLMGNFPDGLRDRVFVRPYVDAGVMKTNRFNEMTSKNMAFALEHLLDEDCTNL